MVEAFGQFPELARVSLDPFVPASTKVKIMDSILKDSKATTLTKRLFSKAVLHVLGVVFLPWKTS